MEVTPSSPHTSFVKEILQPATVEGLHHRPGWFDQTGRGKTGFDFEKPKKSRKIGTENHTHFSAENHRLHPRAGWSDQTRKPAEPAPGGPGKNRSQKKVPNLEQHFGNEKRVKFESQWLETSKGVEFGTKFSIGDGLCLI